MSDKTVDDLGGELDFEGVGLTQGRQKPLAPCRECGDERCPGPPNPENGEFYCGRCGVFLPCPYHECNRPLCKKCGGEADFRLNAENTCWGCARGVSECDCPTQGASPEESE